MRVIIYIARFRSSESTNSILQVLLIIRLSLMRVARTSSESTNSILQILLIIQISLMCVARTSEYTNYFLNIAYSLVCIARIYAVHEHDQLNITNYVCIRVM